VVQVPSRRQRRINSALFGMPEWVRDVANFIGLYPRQTITHKQLAEYWGRRFQSVYFDSGFAGGAMHQRRIQPIEEYEDLLLTNLHVSLRERLVLAFKTDNWRTAVFGRHLLLIFNVKNGAKEFFKALKANRQRIRTYEYGYYHLFYFLVLNRSKQAIEILKEEQGVRFERFCENEHNHAEFIEFKRACLYLAMAKSYREGLGSTNEMERDLATALLRIERRARFVRMLSLPKINGSKQSRLRWSLTRISPKSEFWELKSYYNAY
jgi:hypothetical protein